MINIIQHDNRIVIHCPNSQDIDSIRSLNLLDSSTNWIFHTATYYPNVLLTPYQDTYEADMALQAAPYHYKAEDITIYDSYFDFLCSNPELKQVNPYAPTST